MTPAEFQHYREDPVAFITKELRDPDNNSRPFMLYPAEERFLRKVLTLTPAGHLPYAELVFSAPKKSGKTALSAMCVIYVVYVLGGKFAEAIIVANDLEQAASRVFKAITRIIECSPVFKNATSITANKVVFLSTGATIIAIASDFAGAAGSNANIVAFDELWGFTSESSIRLWDELVPPPTRQVACRLTTTYAGYADESVLLENLYKRGMKGQSIGDDCYEQPGMFMYWTQQCHAPWQTPQWRDQMREQLRPIAFLRLIENQWVTSESEFIDMAWFDQCVDSNLTPVTVDPSLPVFFGVDASTKKDSTAIVGCAWDPFTKRVRVVIHKTWQPSPADPLDFESTIETALLDFRRRFRMMRVYFDPWQLVSVGQRLTKLGIPMEEFPQSVPNLTEASQNLYDLVKGRNLMIYPDPDFRLAMSRCVAKETSRGWRVGKEKQSNKIDLIIALAQSALAAMRSGYKPKKRQARAW